METYQAWLLAPFSAFFSSWYRLSSPAALQFARLLAGIADIHSRIVAAALNPCYNFALAVAQ